MGCLLNTNRVSKKHKLPLRLYDSTVAAQSLYPGLISHMMPLEMDRIILLSLLDQQLSDGIHYFFLTFLNASLIFTNF